MWGSYSASFAMRIQCGFLFAEIGRAGSLRMLHQKESPVTGRAFQFEAERRVISMIQLLVTAVLRFVGRFTVKFLWIPKKPR